MNPLNLCDLVSHGPGVARAEHNGQRLPGAVLAVVGEDGQRVEAFSELNDQGFPVPGWCAELR